MDADETAVFELLADSTRAGILRALAAEHGESPRDPATSFSTLRETVGAEDSGNFNYHLDQLRDRFVQKTEEGYHLTPAGLRVVGAVLSTAGAVEAVDLEERLGEDCPVCGDPLTARYDEGYLRVACPAGHFFPVTTLPPTAVEDRPLETVLETATVAVKNELDLIASGSCPECLAPIDPGVVEREHAPARWRFEAACSRCGMAYGAPVGTCALSVPAVVGYFADRGVEIPGEPLWRFDVWGDGAVDLRERDPLRLSVTVAHDAGAVAVLLDGEATALEVTPR